MLDIVTLHFNKVAGATRCCILTVLHISYFILQSCHEVTEIGMARVVAVFMTATTVCCVAAAAAAAVTAPLLRALLTYSHLLYIVILPLRLLY